MNSNQLLQISFFIFILVLAAKPLGWYMARVFGEKPFFLEKWMGPLERSFYRLAGIRPDEEMDWKEYGLSMLLFSALGGLIIYFLERCQAWLPLNPQHFPAVAGDLSFNTAVSFITNTNWQNYGGETTMSYLTQMLGLAVHNFLSAATGIAVLLALIRGLTRKQTDKVGNYWVDMMKITLYILLPLSFIYSGILIWQGVPQSFKPYQKVSLLQPNTYDQAVVDGAGAPVLDKQGKPKMEKVLVKEQAVPLGPVASQEAIKLLGTNGGGFFNTNSAHPYENPTPLSNFLEILSLVLIPTALCFTFGDMVGDRRQGRALLLAMFLLFIPMLLLCVWSEQRGNPVLQNLVSSSQSVPNMEGKETRFGIVGSCLFTTFTTTTSCGAVNAMHDSYTPLGGLVPLWMMHMGEVVFGGVGCGLYGMLVFVILTVFIAGLMVGRTPEYLGKKIQAYEMKMATVAILIMPVLVLVYTAIGVITAAGRAGMTNPGPHGFSQVLYAFTSMVNNNGSAFAGLNGNTYFYNFLGGVAMWLGRFWMALPVLAISGSLAAKKIVPSSSGTLPTHTPLFILMLACVVVIVGALTFIPALVLGPVIEHLKMIALQGGGFKP